MMSHEIFHGWWCVEHLVRSGFLFVLYFVSFDSTISTCKKVKEKNASQVVVMGYWYLPARNPVPLFTSQCAHFNSNVIQYIFHKTGILSKVNSVQPPKKVRQATHGKVQVTIIFEKVDWPVVSDRKRERKPNPNKNEVGILWAGYNS